MVPGFETRVCNSKDIYTHTHSKYCSVLFYRLHHFGWVVYFSTESINFLWILLKCIIFVLFLMHIYGFCLKTCMRVLEFNFPISFPLCKYYYCLSVAGFTLNWNIWNRNAYWRFCKIKLSTSNALAENLMYFGPL